MSDERRLRLPPPSDPPETRTHGMSWRDDRCPMCPHEWHGLYCRKGSGSCNCQSSIPRAELEAECSGCLTGADIGVPEYGSMIYAAHPDCLVHGEEWGQLDE